MLVQEKQKEDESEKLVVEGKGRQTFLLWEIVYIKSRAHVTEIHTSDGKMYECREKLSELELRVSEKFVRCHQSYLVNKNYVNAIRRNVIELEGTEIPISRKYWEMLKKQL